LEEELGWVGRAVLEVMPDACVLADRTGQVVYVNPAFARVCYREASSLIGKNVFEDNPEGALVQTLRSGQPTIGKRYRVYGGPVEIVAHAYPIFRGRELVGAVAFFRETSPALELLADLEETQRKVRLLQMRLEILGRAEYTLDDLVGTGRDMVHALTIARRAAFSHAPILLCGERGTGKKAVAQAIHNASNRRKEPFFVIRCRTTDPATLKELILGNAQLPEPVSLLEAGDGTVFFDQIEALPLELQKALCRFLDTEPERERASGGCAVIASAVESLDRLVSQRRFLKELYQRLQAVVIELPPLRERLEDLPLLAERMVTRFSRLLGKPVAGIDPELLVKFRSYSWPGNVAELANVLERAVMLVEENGVIGARHVYLPPSEAAGAEEVILPLDEMERIMIARALRKYGTSVAGKKEAAKALNISLTTLYNKLRRGGHLRKTESPRLLRGSGG
jgi:PAS domain S-box-containing protein